MQSRKRQIIAVPWFVFIHTYSLNFLKGKSSALGVGRGRAVAMRARVSFRVLSYPSLREEGCVFYLLLYLAALPCG